MGLNRQRKPGNRETRFAVRRKQFMRHQQELPKMLSQNSRDMIIDVLRHVASGGISVIDDRYFNADSSKDSITIVKNKKLSRVEVMQLLFEKLGFPPDLVAEYLVDVVETPDFSQEVSSIFQAVAPDSRYGEVAYNSQWDLFEAMLWHKVEEESASTKDADNGPGSVGSPSSPPGAGALVHLGDNEEVAAEVEQVAAVFGDQYVGSETDVFGAMAGSSPSGTGNGESANEQSPDNIGSGRDLIFRFQSADGVDVFAAISLGIYYPKDPPLIALDPSLDTFKNSRITTASFSLSPLMRRKLLDSAVRSIQVGMGECLLLSLIGGLESEISALTLKPQKVLSASAKQQLTPLPSVSERAKREAEEKAKFLEFLKAQESGGADTTQGRVSPASTSSRANHTSPVEEKKQDESNMQYVLPAKVELTSVNTSVPKRGTQRRMKRDPELDAKLKKDWEFLRAKGSLSKARTNLPAHAMREELRAAVAANPVVIVSGETGSGKTTQVPQFLYEFFCEEGRGSTAHLVCTQPRRLAATSVAIRVAEERDEQIGNTVGYSIRLESRASERTRILYCTTGIVLRRMQSDPNLREVSHVIVDEIHERGVDTDFLLILLKDLLERRDDLKIVLMSATMDSMLFSRYFNDAPVVKVSGRTFPVDVFMLEHVISKVNYHIEDGSPYAIDPRQARRGGGGMRNRTRPGAAAPTVSDFDEYQEDVAVENRVQVFRQFAPDQHSADTLSRMDLSVINYELVCEVVAYICSHYRNVEGAILIFMPGMAEISQCIEELKFTPGLRDTCVFYNLHSSLGSSEQRAVFARPPRGIRKVIVGTNIMETSITIDDAVFVIDSGKVKENRYDPRKSLSQLITMWVSKANAKQRTGRAGRVRPGVCFRLYTTPQFEDFEESQLCEMHRVPLESLILQVYTLNLGDEVEFLSKALSPPEEAAIKSSVKVLSQMGALTYNKRLTSLGAHLANLAIDVKIGKMVIHGALLSCLDPVVTIAACLSVKSPFLSIREEQNAIRSVQRSFAGSSRSDQMAVWYAYQKWVSIMLLPASSGGGEVAASAFCQRSYLSPSTLYQIQATKRQYEWMLVEAGFINVKPEQLQRRRRNIHFVFDPLRTLDEHVVYEAGGASYNTHSADARCILACLVAGLYPNIAKVCAPSKRPGLTPGQAKPDMQRLMSLDGSNVMIHPGSILAKENELRYPLVCYVDKVKTSMTFLRECSMVSPFMVILFGSVEVEFLEHYNEMLVDKLLCFRCQSEEAMLLKHIKDQFETALKMKINDPTVSWEAVSRTVVKAIMKLLRDEGSVSKSMVIVEHSSRKPLTAPLSKPSPQTQAAIAARISSSFAPPPPPPLGQNVSGGRTCFNCGEVGHVSRFCPQPLPPKQPGAPSIRCFICGQWHHPMDCEICLKA